MDTYPGTREEVLKQILERILTQEDDNDRRHDGYQRRIVVVEGHTNEDADGACEVLAERVRNVYARKGRDIYELAVHALPESAGTTTLRVRTSARAPDHESVCNRSDHPFRGSVHAVHARVLDGTQAALHQQR